MTGRRDAAGRVGLALVAALVAAAGLAQSNPTWREWNQPVEPFRIFGPLYYVGASDVTAFAFATSDGLIVLDGGSPETAPQIRRNLETLGFGIDQVKVLINTHAHVDHAGGLAELKRASGARMVASEGDAPLLEAGGKGDFAFGDEIPYPPVTVDRRVRDGDTLTLGGLTLTANVTAGHTKGCTTWTAKLESGGVVRDAVFICSTSVADPERYRLADNPDYPTIAEDYEATFARLRSLPCDLFLASHGSFFGLAEKAKRLQMGLGMTNPFVDPQGYRDYVERSERRFRELLAEARSRSAGASPPATTSANSPGSEGRPASSASSSDSRP